MSLLCTIRPVERIPVSGFAPRGFVPRLIATLMLSSVWLGAFVLGGMVPALLKAAEQEANLLAVLTGDAPAADKALACKQLAVHGSEAAAPELAKLLSHPQLASWARIALEAIPGPAVDAALRQSAESLEGDLLVGVVNSIGVRRDGSAVPQLVSFLARANTAPETAAAAAVALGRIGNAGAEKGLLSAMNLADLPVPVRSALAEGCVLVAEQRLAAGQAIEAATLYDQVRQADVPLPRRLDATRGAILARLAAGPDADVRQAAALKLLAEQLQSPEMARFRLGLRVVRETESGAVAELLAAELDRAAADRAPLVLLALADQAGPVALRAVRLAAESGKKELRIAALRSLGQVGDASCLDSLLANAASSDPEIAAAARTALAELPDPKANEALVARLNQADTKSYPVLIEAIGERRIDAGQALIAALDHPDSAVRTAALSALGNTISFAKLPLLMTAVTKPKRPEDEAVALKALQTACVRMPDREACATALDQAMQGSSTNTKVAILPIVAAVGGTRALAVMNHAAKSNDDKLQDASTRLLGEWSTIDAAPVLLDLSKSAPGEKYRTRALRGYIRIARQFVMPEPQRLEMCQQILASTSAKSERSMVLEILKRYPSVGTLQLAARLSDSPDLKEEAQAAIVAIVQKIGPVNPQVVEALNKTGLEKVKVEIIEAQYGAGSSWKDVTALVRKQAGDSRLILIEGGASNTGLGGDPAPGQVKQLKIQYRLNGKAGEATFAENALILLPQPK
jgi:HEAT repeat protein